MRAAREARVRKIFIVMQRVQQIHARAVLIVFFYLKYQLQLS